jgi:hypothetical protein
MSLLDKFLSERSNMVPIKKHVEILEKFKKRLDEIKDGLEIMRNENLEEEKKDAYIKLCNKYFDGFEIWKKIDNFIEYEVLPFVDKNI